MRPVTDLERRVAPFEVKADYDPSGDQPAAIAEITKRMRGTKRTVIETFNRLVVSAVAAFMVWYGLKNAILDLGSFRMPSLIPLTYYTASVPLSGLLIGLFAIEQLVNGWRNGFEGPEDTDDFARATE